ncbi:B-cell receptor-associated protein 31-like-domain-containing protein, partial [Protomyces lactucae-debilis]
LCIEMVLFVILVLPLRSKGRHMVINFLNNTLVASKLLHGFKISVIFVFVLFLDACRGVSKKAEVSSDLTMSDKLANAKLVSQRNLYLCGFSLFLAFALWRVEGLLEEIDGSSE